MLSSRAWIFLFTRYQGPTMSHIIERRKMPLWTLRTIAGIRLHNFLLSRTRSLIINRVALVDCDSLSIHMNMNHCYTSTVRSKQNICSLISHKYWNINHKYRPGLGGAHYKPLQIVGKMRSNRKAVNLGLQQANLSFGFQDTFWPVALDHCLHLCKQDDRECFGDALLSFLY